MVEVKIKILYLPNCYSQQRQREKKANIYPVLMAMEAEKYRQEGHEVIWNPPILNKGKLAWDDTDKVITKPEGLPFLSLPHPDRVFTRAKEYTSGNYKYLPGTHLQAANGCFWGACRFCVEKGKPYEVRPVDDVIEEIEECKTLGFKGVFDDSGTFPIGKWLNEFIIKKYDLCKGIKLGCNLRMVDVDYQSMKEAGFRMLLFGLESANQDTLDRINKGTRTSDVKYIIKAAEARLEPHIAFMVSYPWETDQDAVRTLKLVHWLLRKGYAKTAQASFYNPPGGGGKESHRPYVKKVYDVWKYPDFWFNKLKDIKNVADLKYLWRQIKAGIWKQ